MVCVRVPASIVAIVLASAPALLAAQDKMDLARLLYNQGQFDAAIQAAREASSVPGSADVAALVVGRSYLERFRQSNDAADLAAGREALRGIDVERLGLRDRLELLVGLAEALFLERAYGAAAELFESLLDRAAGMGPAARERVVDWWATALDREAVGRAREERHALYGRIVERMEEELSRDASVAAASYWVAAGLRGRGDVDRAWSAAIAGWLRAPLTADRGAALRADLDRLMVQAIIPERARKMTAPPEEDGDDPAAALLAEWETFKDNWTRR